MHSSSDFRREGKQTRRCGVLEMASLDSAGITSGIIVDTIANDVLSQAQASSSQEYFKTANVGLEATDVLQQSVEDDTQERLRTFWQKQMEDIQNLSNNEFKTQVLPLARIKKIMKMDDDVKMISAEAPLLFSKAAQMFIAELSLRAWVHTEENKRRTLQRNDIATSITKFDQFDFLIDIVPREELKPMKRTYSSGGSSDVQQYFYTLPQQQQQATVATPMATIGNTGSQSTAQASALQSGQLLITQQNQSGQPPTLTPVNVDGAQILQLAQASQSQQGQSAQQTQAQAVVINAASGNAGQVVLQRQQQATTQSGHSDDQKQQQNIQAVLQQLVGNASNTQGEVHAIQVNSQGQLQLVKVVKPQPQQQMQNMSANTVTGSQQVAGITDQIYNISSGDTNATQATDGITTIYVNPGE